MSDYHGNVFRLLLGSDVVRINPNSIIEFYIAGTATLIWSGTADADGTYSISSLATGKYDIKIDGVTRETIHFVKSDHDHKADETWIFFKSGAISADQEEVNTMPIFAPEVAGTIHKISIVAQNVDATGDVDVHLLRGGVDGSSLLTIATASVWNHKINPGSGVKRYTHNDNNPGVSVSAAHAFTIAFDYTAATVEGVTVLVVFRPDA